LFQQKYSNFKVVVVDNSPELGLQASVLGLLKEVGSGRAIILDRVKGEAKEGSSVFLALHKYCKQT
jgi:hypothetical protein